MIETDVLCKAMKVMRLTQANSDTALSGSTTVFFGNISGEGTAWPLLRRHMHPRATFPHTMQIERYPKTHAQKKINVLQLLPASHYASRDSTKSRNIARVEIFQHLPTRICLWHTYNLLKVFIYRVVGSNRAVGCRATLLAHCQITHKYLSITTGHFTFPYLSAGSPSVAIYYRRCRRVVQDSSCVFGRCDCSHGPRA